MSTAIRKRKVETKEGTAAVTEKAPVRTVTEEMEAEAVKFYTENQLANEHGTKAKNIRKSLFADMLSAGVKAFKAVYRTDAGNRVDLQVEIAPGRSTSEVNMKRLRKLVNDDEKLLSLCTMTRTDVVTYFGTALAEQVCEMKPGAENVQVKVAK